MTPSEILSDWRANFAPRTVLAGTLLGFAAMCGLGRYVARIDYHDNFTRFTPWMAPDTKYYPTVNEMMAIVRHTVKPGQILVIIGGNSVIYGVGQPPGHVWSQSLQQDLGDEYCVINFALRGAPPTNGGAVAAEALRHEYPRQIYIANLAPTQAVYPDGSPVYRFTNYEAYYKGLLIDDPVRNAEIKRSHQIPEYYLADLAVPELRIREFFDSLFYFQDLWNYITFTKVNTVWGFYFPGVVRMDDPIRFLDPRMVYRDPEPDFLKMPLSARYLDSTIDAELLNVRGVSMYAFNKDSKGKWQLYAPLWDNFMRDIAGAFPQPLKRRTLIVLGYNSPFYLSRLPPDEQERNDLSFQYAVKEWEKGGYSALAYGKDYTVDDAGDRTHLTWHGGQKLAKVVAVKVREMSQELGYLKP